jgi:hypothetical protein
VATAPRFPAEGNAMAGIFLARVGLARPGLVGLSPPADRQGGLRDALRGLPDVPNADWPLLLLAVCGAVLALLALWGLAKALRGPDPTESQEGGRRDKGRLPSESRRTPMLLEETKALLVSEPPTLGAGSGGKGPAPSFWNRLLAALLRALAIPGA